MALLTDELRARLPPLFSQEGEEDPMIYARIFLPGTSLNWYVLEGQASGSDLILSCAFDGNEEFSFGHFPESFLELFRGPNGELVQQDKSFTEGRLTDVVPAPDL
jgi:hypothetical protein